MISQQYFTKKKAPVDNVCDMSRPLILNCAGRVHTAKKFTSSSIRHDYYLQFVDIGSLTLEDGKEMLAESFIVRSPETTYKYTNSSDELSYYWVHFTGSQVLELMSSLGLELDRVYDISSADTEHIKRDFSTIFNELTLRREAFEEMCAARLHTVLVRFSRLVMKESEQSRTSRYRSRLAKSLELIHLRYAESLTIDELAKTEHLSKSRYREIFRAALGTSPVEYITSLRITRACELLGTTDLSVTEIAHICGFDDEPYFCRVFRKSMGTSPLAYRKSV